MRRSTDSYKTPATELVVAEKKSFSLKQFK